MMTDELWSRLALAQATVAGLEAENRELRLTCRRYLREWTDARDALRAMKHEKEGANGTA
jgi:hypothetical protein